MTSDIFHCRRNDVKTNRFLAYFPEKYTVISAHHSVQEISTAVGISSFAVHRRFTQNHPYAHSGRQAGYKARDVVRAKKMVPQGILL